MLDVLGMPTDNGQALIERFSQQVAGIELITVRCNSNVVHVRRDAGALSLRLEDGSSFSASAVLLATGTRPRRLNIPGEQLLQTKEDARSLVENYAQKRVMVIGGGDEGSDIACCLAKAGADVTMLVRASLGARPRFAEPLLKQSKVAILENTEAVSIEGEPGARLVRTHDGQAIEVAEVFVRIGVEPIIPGITPELKRHQDGRVCVDAQTGTSIEGIYAAGDLCRLPEQRYVTVAMSDGVLAARAVEAQLAE